MSRPSITFGTKIAIQKLNHFTFSKQSMHGPYYFSLKDWLTVEVHDISREDCDIISKPQRQITLTPEWMVR